MTLPMVRRLRRLAPPGVPLWLPPDELEWLLRRHLWLIPAGVCRWLD